MTERQKCEWCHGPIDPAARRDTKTCSKACRQAKSRFRVSSAGAAVDEPMHFGYADPPYLGMARKYYGCDEVDHQELIEGLTRRFQHGWALSASAESLQEVLAMCPPGVRVACWIRGARPGKSWRPRSAWEPLIVYRGRARRIGVNEASSDVLLWGGRQHSHPGALIGMKPATFAEWMFEQLGALRGDTLVDMFPGSGAIGRAWDLYQGTGATGVTTAPSDMSRGDEDAPRGIRDGSRNDASRPRSSDKSVTRAERDSCLVGAERQLERLLSETE